MKVIQSRGANSQLGPHRQFIRYRKLGLNFGWAGTNNAMTHVMVLSAKVRRKERLI